MRYIGLIARRILLFCTVLVFLFPFTGFAAADGGIFVEHRDYFFIEEDSQFGVINYADGIQTLFISVRFAWRESSRAAWIFPVPSDPDLVDVGIADGHISFSGTNVVERARDELVDAAQDFTTGYGLSFALPWFLPMMVTELTVGDETAASLGARDGEDGTGVTVHTHVEMEGLIVEVISATGGEGIYEYLTGRGLHIPEGAVPQLGEHVKEEFSFVVTWIEETGTTLRMPGVVVGFPTDKMYYPLRLTSVYGDHRVPMSVIVVGHVSPGVYWDILPHTEVTYHEGSVSGGAYPGEGGSPAAREVEAFVNSIRDGWDGAFTAIELDAPSKAFTQDLWISSDGPPKLTYAFAVETLFGSVEVLTFFLMFLLLSPFLGIAVGALVLGPGKEHIHVSALMGLSNLVGILGLLVFALSFRLDNAFSTRQGISFVVMFSILFYTIVMTILGILYLPLL